MEQILLVTLMSNAILYVIDDEQQSVNLFMEFASLLGYKTQGFTQAIEFFNQAEDFVEGSVVVLDLVMPEMDGVEVMRKMVELNRKLPLILVSGYDAGVLHSAEQLAMAYSLDIVSTLTKPFDFKIFKQAINKLTNFKKFALSPSEFTVTAEDLAIAIEQNQLLLHYQPQIDIKTKKLIGVEALSTWQHPRFGLIKPDVFIPIAEKSGLIKELTALVIKQAMEQALYWKSKQLLIQVSVNISAENIISLSLPEQLKHMLDIHKLDPAMLTLEVTESALMGELITSLDILTRLRMKGIQLSIDDFGTGYSSLSQLYRMPFTELKVDKSFVINMSNDEDARGIVKTCIRLGHELKMKVVAEGVEDQQTFEILNDMGCDIVQGFYIARPMPAEQIIPWLKGRDKNSERESVLEL